MGRLVHDLLDLARMEGHVELHLQPLALDNLLRRVQRKFAALCKDKEIELQLELTEEMTHLEQADEDRLEQVLTNLLDNAIRHTGEGGSITLRTLPATWQGMPAVTLEVEDKGEGIPAADLPFVFERFYKADKARTRKRSGGTGLGLAIVKNIVEAHKGHIEARSKVNQGTVFSITLPLRWNKEPS
jgi:two-component system sensor histidine kinase ResE